MPGLDSTGPEGKGPKTGRGLGNCGSKTKSSNSNKEEADNSTAGNMRRRQRMGRKGGGMGRGNRHRGGQEG